MESAQTSPAVATSGGDGGGDGGGPRTSYQRVASALRGRILKGDFQPGQQLPTEGALCQEFGVSRITTRRAMQILVEERLIYRRQGSGSFVSDRPTRRIPLLQAGFSKSINEHAPELTRQVLRLARRSAGLKVAQYLGLSPGDPVVYARRLDLLDGKAVAYDELFIPEKFGDRLDLADLETVAFSPHWAKVQAFAMSHISQQIEAINASARQAKILQLRPRVALLKTLEVIHESGGRPAGLFITYYHGRTFHLSATCHASVGRDVAR